MVFKINLCLVKLWYSLRKVTSPSLLEIQICKTVVCVSVSRLAGGLSGQSEVMGLPPYVLEAAVETIGASDSTTHYLSIFSVSREQL